MPHLSIRVLGPFQVSLDGEPLSGFNSDKVRALLAYLALSPDRPRRRESLAGLLWPEFPERSARTNLRNALANLRRVIRDREVSPSYLHSTHQTLRFNGRSDYWLDAVAFEALVATVPPTSEGLEQAVSLVRGPFLEGFSLADAAPFEEWLLLRREQLGRQMVEALDSLAAIYEECGAHEQALAHAQRRVDLEPWQEDGQRLLMRLLARSGHRSKALAQYKTLRGVLAEELGLDPAPETTQLYEQIRNGELELPTPPEEPGNVSLSPAPRHNLPPQPTPFVGREAELAEIARLLQDPDCRLLTLIGPGGVGKSRLALEATAEQLSLSPSPCPHGVCFVPLAPVTSDELIVPTIADALGFSFYPREGEDPKQQLLSYLCEKQMLLLLDNFEQLMDSADLLSEILEHAPGLRLLVTSRERLNLQREWLFEVQGMRYPGEEMVESLKAYTAIVLFLRRASQVDAGFAVPEEGFPDLIRICRLVEGLPLGIELSAAWVKMLSCREIADEIERSLDFLTTSMRDVPERHRSLRAVCDHSWALLSEEERATFRRLSVFRGGFQQEAAEHVAGARLPLLSALMDKSLLRRERPARYQVHEVLHQYAAEKLAQAPEEEKDAHNRHSAYFAGFLHHREGALKGADQMVALEEIGADLQNVRTAWRWAVAQCKVAEIRQTAPSLWLFYAMRSLLEEGEQAFAQAVAMLDARAGQGAETDAALGLALAYQGWFAGRLYRFEDAAKLLRRSQALLHRLGARWELALANSLSFFPGTEECFPEAEQLLQESLALYRRLGDRWGVAFALSRFLWSTRRSWDARRYLQESLAIGREIGDRWTVGLCLFQLGEVLQLSGTYREAKERYKESLAVFRELGDRHAEQMSLDHVGYVARDLGEYEEARHYHLESLTISQQTGDRLGTAGSLDNLGLVARDLGDYTEAERYLREGLVIREEVGNQWAISVSLVHLGDVALAQGNYEEARRSYQESLEVSRGSEPPEWPAEALRGLGAVSSAEGDFQQAGQHFRDALELEMTGQGAYIPLVLEILVAVAQFAVRIGEKEKPAEWLAYVVDQPGSSAQMRDKAKRLLDELASQLPPEAIAAAQERGRGKTLNEIVQASLEVLGS